MKTRLTLVGALVALSLASGSAWTAGPQAQPGRPPAAPRQGSSTGGQQPVRDRASQTSQGIAAISGRVVAADTGRPVKRARVSASGGGRGTRTTLTDDQGRYQIAGLAAGNYTVSASKAGFVDGVYGQRRPLQPGTPLTLADTQTATNIDIHVMRGGVITGHVGDEDGEPLPRALVTIQRYQYVRGERQLMTAGGDQTDDRGQYRVFGLPPGEYYVSASTAGLGEVLGRGLQQLAAGLGPPGGRGGGPGANPPGAFAAVEQPEQAGYAPTYYPGVVNTAEAGKLTLAPGQEVSGIDFQIQLVPLARVAGIVSGADGANVMLVPQDGATGFARLGGQMFTGRVAPDGTFVVTNVPPGRYTAIARSGGRSGDPRTAMQSIVVNGQAVEGVTLILQPGVTLSGNITVESAGTPAPTDYSVFRVDIPDVDPLPGGGPGGRGGRGGPFGADNRVEKNGSFSIANLQPGLHYVRVIGGGVQGVGQWALKSVMLGGADVADVPFELKPSQNVENVTVVLTDRATELGGTIRDTRNAGAGGVTVIAFASEPQYWRAQSRRIATARTGQSGDYRIRNLPAGDYYVIAVDDVEQGEWFDPAYLESVKEKATRVTLNDGDKKTLDLRGPS